MHSLKSVILSERSESKDLRTIVAAKQFFSAKIPRLRFTPLGMTPPLEVYETER